MANKKIIAFAIIGIAIIIALFYVGRWQTNRIEQEKMEGKRSAQKIEEGVRKLDESTPKYEGLSILKGGTANSDKNNKEE